jgi:hypothetical protein
LQAAASTVLDWLTGRSHRRRVQVIDGLVRRCASQEGNALAVACRLGMAGDPRAELLARSLVDWQSCPGGTTEQNQAPQIGHSTPTRYFLFAFERAILRAAANSGSSFSAAGHRRYAWMALERTAFSCSTRRRRCSSPQWASCVAAPANQTSGRCSHWVGSCSRARSRWQSLSAGEHSGAPAGSPASSRSSWA